MSDDKKVAQHGLSRSTPLVAPMGFVKGGTTSAREDERVAALHADTHRRRAMEDSRFRAARAHAPHDLKQLRNTGISARMNQMSLGGADSHAMVVLGLKHKKDNQILDWITCEISVQGAEADAELLLIICCPQCVFRHGRHPQDSQLTIRQSNRKFYLDQRTRNERQPNAKLGFCAGEPWVNPSDPDEVITVAGMVTTEDWIKCPNLGCSWEFKIDDSVVHTR